jgi:DedD protein
MDPRAKQRLTGAIILVALFVLLVPELLTGPKSTSVPRTVEDEGLRRYTIDLDTPRAVNAPAAQPDVALPAVADAPAESQRAVPGESAVAEPAIPAVVDARPAAATPPASEPAAAQPAPVPAPVTKPTTSSPAKGSFVVQLGSFGSRDNAERLVRDMTAKGFKTFIAPISTNGRELYRVRVGPTRDRAAAEALATQLKRVGQSGSIVPIS